MESEETKNMGRFFHPIENDGEKPWRRDEAVRMCGSGYWECRSSRAAHAPIGKIIIIIVLVIVIAKVMCTGFCGQRILY